MDELVMELAPLDASWTIAHGLPCSRDELLHKLDSSALKVFEEADTKLSVSATVMSDGTKCLVAVGLAAIETSDVRDHGGGTFKLLALWVDEKHRRQGLGQELYSRLHSQCFYICQLICEEAVNCTHQFRVVLGDGSCLKRVELLLLYLKNGATVHSAKGTLEVFSLEDFTRFMDTFASMDDVAKRSAQRNKDETTVTFPRISLKEGYLLPVVAAKIGDRSSFTLVGTSDPPARSTKQRGYHTWHFSHQYITTQAIINGSVRVGPWLAFPRTGTLTLSFPAFACAALDNYMRQPINHKYELMDLPAEDGTTVSHIQHYMLVQGTDVRLRGYYGYDSTLAKDHDSSKQSARTATAQTKEEFDALFNLPGWHDLFVSVYTAVGCTTAAEFTKLINGIHFLCQDVTNQVTFDWHSDGPDLNIGKVDERRLLSIAIQLSNTLPTAMQVAGCVPTIYGGQGAGVAFHGGCVHRSLPWEPIAHKTGTLVHKVVFFLLPRGGAGWHAA